MDCNIIACGSCASLAAAASGAGCSIAARRIARMLFIWCATPAAMRPMDSMR
jgi:hypothetical protein